MEIYKDIPNYEGLYQVSNLGNVKSLGRKVKNKNGYRLVKGKILKPNLSYHNYYRVGLYKNNKLNLKKIHQLVAMAFLNHKTNKRNDLVIDHINNIKTDNRLKNLQIITNRENCSKDKKGTSKYTGVSWHNRKNKWISGILINGKRKHLGYFKEENDAHLAYQKALKKINNDRIPIT